MVDGVVAVLRTLAEAAEELRLSTDSIRQLVRAGLLPVVYPAEYAPLPA